MNESWLFNHCKFINCLNFKFNYYFFNRIFIARQFYHLYPFLIEFLRYDSDENENSGQNETGVYLQQQHVLNKKKSTEDGFKLLQFYYDKVCS